MGYHARQEPGIIRSDDSAHVSSSFGSSRRIRRRRAQEAGMGHATPEELADLAAELAVVRTWPEVKETSQNVFYVKRTPFLHFHTKDERRWADVRFGADWGPQIEVPHPASAKARSNFLKTVELNYRATLQAVTGKRKTRR
jgi:hypothetical protein